VHKVELVLLVVLVARVALAEQSVVQAVRVVHQELVVKQMLVDLLLLRVLLQDLFII
jgi:hypothetical protein